MPMKIREMVTIGNQLENVYSASDRGYEGYFRLTSAIAQRIRAGYTPRSLGHARTGRR